MMTEKQSEIMLLLQEYLKDAFGKAELIEQEGIHFLRFIPDLFTDDARKIYIEICLWDYSEDVMMAQVYVTLLFELGNGKNAILEKLEEWNFKSTAGNYGIYEKLGHLYHKQNIILIKDRTVDEQVEHLFVGICMVMDEISRRFLEATALTNSKMEDF